MRRSSRRTATARTAWRRSRGGLGHRPRRGTASGPRPSRGSRPGARHWVFVSSGNAYASFRALEQDEDAPMRDPGRGRHDQHGGLRRGEGGLRGRGSSGARRRRPSSDPVSSVARATGRGAPATGPGGSPTRWGTGWSCPTTSTSPAPSSTSATSRPGWSPRPSSGSTARSTRPAPRRPLREVLATPRGSPGSTATPLPVPPERLTELGMSAGWGRHPCRCGSTTPSGAGSRRWTPPGRAPRAGHPPARGDAARHPRLRGGAHRAARPGLTDDDERRVQEAVLVSGGRPASPGSAARPRRHRAVTPRRARLA